MNKTYIGIDPGDKGGIAVIEPGKEPRIYPMPLIEDEDLDIEKILEYIDVKGEAHIAIEEVHSIFGSSASSNFSFGFGCGALYAVVKVSGIPFTRVQPKRWQKEMWQGVTPITVLDKGKKNKDGTPKYKVDTKSTSNLAATRLFPKMNFLKNSRCKVNHDGMVDATLIAEYAKRKNF